MKMEEKEQHGEAAPEAGHDPSQYEFVRKRQAKMAQQAQNTDAYFYNGEQKLQFVPADDSSDGQAYARIYKSNHKVY